MDKQYFFVAIDVSRDELVVAAFGRRITTFKNTRRGITALNNWSAKLAGNLETWFVMESTGVYSSFTATELFKKRDGRISIINPARIKAHGRAIGRRSKTDSQDAQVILDYALKNELQLYYPTPKVFHQLKQFVDQVASYKAMIRVIKNRMHAQGFVGAIKELERANLAVIKSLEKQISKLEGAMAQLVEEDRELDNQVQLLASIPGIGTASAVQILAYTRGEITKRSAKELTAFAGLAPMHRESGTFRGRSRIDKQGNAPLRTTLYMCSLSAAECNPAMRPPYRRLILRENNPLAKKQARVAVMRKLLVLARAILISGKPFDPKLHPQLA